MQLSSAAGEACSSKKQALRLLSDCMSAEQSAAQRFRRFLGGFLCPSKTRDILKVLITKGESGKFYSRCLHTELVNLNLWLPAQAGHDVALRALQHPQVAGEWPSGQPEVLVHKDVVEVDG